MNVNKTGQLLRKINNLFESISSESGDISRIERDLLLQYLRRAYEAASEEGVEDRAKPVGEKTASYDDSRPAKDRPADKPALTTPNPETAEKEKEAAGEREDAANSPQSQEVRATDAPADENGSGNGKSSSEVPPEIQELFEHKEAVEISDRLSQTPISDLKQSMSINERIQATYELFGGDDRSFQNALQKINELQSFGEAREYLLENWAMTNEWGKPDRRSTAAHFVHLVYRKFK